MFEDIKEFLKEEDKRCDEATSCDDCKIKMSGCPDYNLNELVVCEDIIKEAEEYMPRKLIYPAIYKHFKHKEDGIPNNYIYAVKCVSKPVDDNIINDNFSATITTEHTESKELILSYLVNGEFVHDKDMCNDVLVVYTPLYDEHISYSRPIDMFMSKIDHDKYPDVKQKYRFELVRY